MIPVWNELTQAYELPPNVYYGLPFPYFEVITSVAAWLFIAAYAFYYLKRYSLYTPCFMAALCGSFFGGYALFNVWQWNFRNIIWNVNPQVDYAAAVLVFIIISTVFNFAVWVVIIAVHRWYSSKKIQEAEA